MAGLEPEFAKRNCKIIGLSVDPVTSHSKWSTDIEETQGHKVKYPMIGDPELNVAKLYDMLPADAGDTSEGRTAATNATVRTVFVIGPDKKIKLMLSYPMSTGRNFDEVLRVLDSIQLTAKHKVATPVNWKQGEDVIISGAVSDEEAKKKYPGGWKIASALSADHSPTEVGTLPGRKPTIRNDGKMESSNEPARNPCRLSDSIWAAWPTHRTRLPWRGLQPSSTLNRMLISTFRRQPARDCGLTFIDD